MLYAFTGTPGAGKTLHMLNALYHEIKRLSVEHFQYQKALGNLYFVFWLRGLIRLVRSLRARGFLPIIPYRKIWRKFFLKLSKPKEDVVPIIFINIEVILEWWQKEFPHIDFRVYPKESDTLHKLIGDYPDYKKQPCPVFSSIWVFDELQMFFPKSSSSAKPNRFEQFFEKHRHYGVNMYFTTQSMSLTSHHIRQLIEKQFHVTNPFRTGLVRIQEHIGAKTSPRERDAATVRQATAPKKLFSAYKSSQKHIEKKHYPLSIKIMAVGIGGYVIFVLWVFLFPDQPSKQEPKSKPQSLGFSVKPIEAKPIQQFSASQKPIDKPSESSIKQEFDKKKAAELGGDSGFIKKTGWKIPQEKNPFSEFGVSDPSHVSFHGVMTLGKTAYRMCFYVKNFYCAWVKLPETVKVNKFFTTTLLMWEDWVIPQTPEGVHIQTVNHYKSQNFGNPVSDSIFLKGVSSVGQGGETAASYIQKGAM